MMSALKSLIVILFLLVAVGTAAFLWMSSSDLKATYVEPPKPVLTQAQIERLKPKVTIPDTAKPISLTNKAGKTISAHLISKSENKVEFISDGKKYTLKLSVFDDRTQKEIRNWKPAS